MHFGYSLYTTFTLSTLCSCVFVYLSTELFFMCHTHAHRSHTKITATHGKKFAKRANFCGRYLFDLLFFSDFNFSRMCLLVNK